MIVRIARKEFVDTLRDGRFRWGGAVVLALLLVALGAGWAHQREVAGAHAAATEQTWEHWLAQDERNPHSAAHYGVYAFKPVTALSFVDPGVDPYTGVTTWLEAHRQNPFEYRPAQDASAISRFGVLHAAGVLQLLIPLLIVLFAASAVSGEREHGTLRQLLGMGVNPRDLLVGKALGLGGALASLLVPAALLGAWALSLAARPSGGAEPIAVLLLGLTYLTYFAVFIALALAVSARASSSRAALIALLAFWTVNGLVTPRAAAGVAEALAPLPTTAEFDVSVQVSLREGVDGRSSAAERARMLEDSVLTHYGASSLEELPVNFAGISLQSREEDGNVVFDHHYGELNAIVDRHLTLHLWAGLLAPLLPARELSMRLAGTDVHAHRVFVEAAEGHRRLIQRMMNDDITANGRWGEEYVAGPELWATVPRFDPPSRDLAWTLRAGAPSAAMLLLWMGGSALLLIGSARRLRPELS